MSMTNRMYMDAAAVARHLRARGITVMQTAKAYETACPVCRSAAKRRGHRRLLIYDDPTTGKTLIRCAANFCKFEAICDRFDLEPSRLFPTCSGSSSLLPTGQPSQPTQRDGHRGGSGDYSPCNNSCLIELYEKGELEPLALPDLAPLPPSAGRAMRAIYAELALMTGLRRAWAQGRPALTAQQFNASRVPLSEEYLAKRLGMPSGEISRALHALEGRSVRAHNEACREARKAGRALPSWQDTPIRRERAVIAYAGKLQHNDGRYGQWNNGVLTKPHHPPRCYRLLRIRDRALPREARGREAARGVGGAAASEPALHSVDVLPVQAAEMLGGVRQDADERGLLAAVRGAAEPAGEVLGAAIDAAVCGRPIHAAGRYPPGAYDASSGRIVSRCASTSWATGRACGHETGVNRTFCREHFNWLELEALLLDYRDGVLAPAPVALPNLEGLSSGPVRMARLFELAYGLRLAVGHQRPAPMPFGVDWAMWHLGASRRRAVVEARAALIASAAIAHTQHEPARLFVPMDELWMTYS